MARNGKDSAHQRADSGTHRSSAAVQWWPDCNQNCNWDSTEGLRFGYALCIEAHFPEIFAEYETLNADCVLLSVMVDDPIRPLIAQAYAALYDYWVGYSTPAQYGRSAPAGIAAPGGRWIARCPANSQPGIAVADLDPQGDSDIDIAVRLARPWRRTARAGLYDDRQAPEDPRSADRVSF